MESIKKVVRKEGRKFSSEHTTVFEKKVVARGREGGREGGVNSTK